MINVNELSSLDPGAYFTVEEVAKILRMSRSGVRNWITRGKIKSFRRGWQYLVLGADVQAHVKANTHADNKDRAALIDTL